jgi:hypothetical protein
LIDVVVKVVNKSILKITLNISIIGILLLTLTVPLSTMQNLRTIPPKKTPDILSSTGENTLLTNSLYNEGQWSTTFGGERIDRGYSVQQTPDDGYIIAGDTESFGSGKLDFWLIKTDNEGNEEWNMTFGGKQSERCFSCQQTMDKGYIMVGWKSYGTEKRLSDIWLVKTDKDGNEQWNKTYGDTNWNGGYCIRQTMDGGYIIVGETCTMGYEQRDIWLIKTTPNGTIQWETTFGGNKNDYGATVQQTTDGGYIIGGYTQSYNDEYGGILIKTNADGTEEWYKTYDGGISCVQQTNDGGFILTGSIRVATGLRGYPHTDIAILKTDMYGNEEWTQTYGTYHYDEGMHVQQTSDRGYIVLGDTINVRSSMDTDSGDFFDMWLIKTDASGSVVWMKKLGGNHYEYAHEAHETTDGGYIIVGDTWSFGAGETDVWLIKTREPTLKIRFTQRFMGLSIIINNTGDTDVSDMEWSTYIEGLVVAGRNNYGTIEMLSAGEEITLTAVTFLGFGPVAIIVTVGDSAMIFRCFLLGYLIFPY